jgi:hypothetical protein
MILMAHRGVRSGLRWNIVLLGHRSRSDIALPVDGRLSNVPSLAHGTAIVETTTGDYQDNEDCSHDTADDASVWLQRCAATWMPASNKARQATSHVPGTRRRVRRLHLSLMQARIVRKGRIER